MKYSGAVKNERYENYSDRGQGVCSNAQWQHRMWKRDQEKRLACALPYAWATETQGMQLLPPESLVPGDDVETSLDTQGVRNAATQWEGVSWGPRKLPWEVVFELES